ncbi:MAG: hypothetical protein H6807_15605 [Planctomycetes bacterium]|nr:hypothetical protein [Planctomycetota bacterium]
MARGHDIAVDGGGSRLRAFLVMGGEVVESLARPIGVNPNTVGPERTVAEVARIVRDLAAPCRRPGRPEFDRIDRVACGLAGVGEAVTRLAVHVGLRAQLGNRVALMSDAEALLAAARPEGEVVILIVGTGSIAVARDRAGQLHRVGGTLPMGGDPGGGDWLARRAATRFPELASLGPVERCPEVDRRARAGDWNARGLLEEAARELAGLLDELLRGADLEAAPLVIHGGLIANSEILRHALRRRIEEAGMSLIPTRPRFDPRLGPLIALRPPTESSWPDPIDAPIL